MAKSSNSKLEDHWDKTHLQNRKKMTLKEREVASKTNKLVISYICPMKPIFSWNLKIEEAILRENYREAYNLCLFFRTNQIGI